MYRDSCRRTFSTRVGSTVNRKWKSAPPGGPVLFTSGYPEGPMPRPNARGPTWTSSASARHLCAWTRAWSARDESEAVVSAYDVPLNAITKTAEHMPYRTAPAATRLIDSDHTDPACC